MLLILLANHPNLWINIKGTPSSAAIDIDPELNIVFINGTLFGPFENGATDFSVLPTQPVGTENISAPKIPLVIDRPNLYSVFRR